MAWIVFPLYSYGCSFDYIGAPYSVNYGNIVVQRDAPVGQAISNEISGPMAMAYSCLAAGYEGSEAGMKKAALTYAFTAANGARVYNTNVPGVGISLGFNENSTGGEWASYMGNAWLEADIETGGWTSNPGDKDIWNFQPIIQFWKTGNITSGSVTGHLASFVAWSTKHPGGTAAPEIPVYAGSGSIIQVACTITTPNLVFPIGEVLLSSFGSTVGTTPLVAQNTQNLGLTCDSDANINITLSGVQNPDVSDESVLALTGQNTPGVASGVGVQLLYNGTPLSLNSTMALKRSSGGQEMFPLTARYYQTATTVTTGIANTVATLILTYQ